jgi:uncharacterized protein (UPF0305 family)
METWGKKEGRGVQFLKRLTITQSKIWWKKKRNESFIADIRRMMVTIFNDLKEELREDIQKQLNESQDNMDKKLEKTKKQTNELKVNFNRL